MFYQLLINKRESTDLKHLNDSNVFIEYSTEMDNIFKNTEEYNPNKRLKILIAFNDMIAHMLNNKNLNAIVTELFIRGIKLNMSLAFILESYFATPKKFLFIDVTLASDNLLRFRENILERT